MTTITTTPEGLGRAIGERVRERLAASEIGNVLVSQAQSRIQNGRDSEIQYEELWASREGVGYRAKGKPLFDIGRLHDALESSTEETLFGVELSLIDGAGYGAKHQNGFVNQPPVAVALTPKARRLIPTESPHDIDSLRERGLIQFVGSLDDQDTEERQRSFDVGTGKKKKRKSRIDEGTTTDVSDADFLVIEKPTTVPARPIFNLPPEDVEELTKSIKTAIGGE